MPLVITTSGILCLTNLNLKTTYEKILTKNKYTKLIPQVIVLISKYLFYEIRYADC